MAYRIEAIPMTLSDIQVIHLMQAFQNVIFVQLCSSWHWQRASRSFCGSGACWSTSFVYL